MARGSNRVIQVYINDNRISPEYRTFSILYDTVFDVLYGSITEDLRVPSGDPWYYDDITDITDEYYLPFSIKWFSNLGANYYDENVQYGLTNAIPVDSFPLAFYSIYGDGYYSCIVNNLVECYIRFTENEIRLYTFEEGVYVPQMLLCDFGSYYGISIPIHYELENDELVIARSGNLQRDSYSHTDLNKYCWRYYYLEITSETQPTKFEFIKSVVGSEITKNSDPYSDGGISGIGGGGGSFTNNDTPVDIPNLPSISAADTGFVTLYNPTIAQLKTLANYMWSSNFDLDTFKKIFANPMDVILGLTIVPVPVPDGGIKHVITGNIDTGVSMTVAGAQYVEVNCGSINLNEYWGAYLDYTPYTKVSIYLPYIGTHELNTDDVMGRTLTLKYHVDILSGACVAYLKCGNSTLYQWQGICAQQIPFSSLTFNNALNLVASGLSFAGSAAIALAAPESIGLAAGAIASGGGFAANAVSANKNYVSRSNGLNGAGGHMGMQYPFLIITRPRQCVASAHNTYTGYPSYVSFKLSNLSGLTHVEFIHLNNMSCTDDEKLEIEKLLTEGVIL